MLAAVAQHLELAGLVAKAVLTQASHDLIHGLSRRLILVEEIAGHQYHINITLPSQAHDLVKGLPAVVATLGITLIVANMVICGDEDADGVPLCVCLR